MVILSSNEQTIRSYPVKVLAIYYLIHARNINGILYPDKEKAAAKLKVDRSTLSRWIQCLLHQGLAVRKETGHVVLVRPKELIRKTNEGRMPHHKCTLYVRPSDGRKEVEEELRIKLLEEFSRQVRYVSRETAITQETRRRYGHIHNEVIKEKVKSRVQIEDDGGFAQMSGKAIAQRMGISKRTWESIQSRLRTEGRITTRQQREIVHNEGKPVLMSAREWWMGKDEFGFTSFRRMNGEVVKVLPNLVRLTSRMSPTELRK